MKDSTYRIITYNTTSALKYCLAKQAYKITAENSDVKKKTKKPKVRSPRLSSKEIPNLEVLNCKIWEFQTRIILNCKVKRPKLQSYSLRGQKNQEFKKIKFKSRG